MQMLAKEFFPSAEIAKSTSELNLSFAGEVWKAEGRGESLAQPMPEKTAYEGMGGDPGKDPNEGRTLSPASALDRERIFPGGF